ncbi:phosphatase PAP2 family protein [Lacinutrix jangbogonensis]|uniref:phosphatase PAP2 family protein n=1 Tax=Lacinutrix jangbogonensis TaxID=1469557 RepID=UPI00053E8D05|nr:phosphatase PAP2 family protein [Lacinutrix jangbogonensis]
MLEQLLQYDKELFLFLNNLGSETWDNLWLIITHKFTFAPLYALLLFLVFKKLGVKGMLFMILVIVLMVTFTDQITNQFKDGFMRLRPCRTDGIMDKMRMVAAYCGKYGYFSGHSSNTMAAAIFAGLLLKPYYKNLIFILVFWSVVVAYSRIYVGVHFPLDIVSGMLFGVFSGFIFYKLATYVLKRFSISK